LWLSDACAFGETCQQRPRDCRLGWLARIDDQHGSAADQRATIECDGGLNTNQRSPEGGEFPHLIQARCAAGREIPARRQLPARHETGF